MYKNHRIAVIIPAYNEESSISKVITDIPEGIVDHLIVVNNNSQDDTSSEAKKAGATVLDQPLQGYGHACLMGVSYVQNKGDIDIVVFLDADYSDYPEYMIPMLDLLIEEKIDFVIGNRAGNLRESGSMTIPQIVGNWIATTFIKIIWGAEFHDLGPFRAIRMAVLESIQMQDKTYGWTVEMQIKAAKFKIPYAEIPVPYRKRVGTSKISGTIRGTINAGYKILWTIFKYLF